MIDELEALRIPSIFCGEMHPYIHFLVVENKPRWVSGVLLFGMESCFRVLQEVPRASCILPDGSLEELRQKVDSMTNQIKVFCTHPWLPNAFSLLPDIDRSATYKAIGTEDRRCTFQFILGNAFAWLLSQIFRFLA